MGAAGDALTRIVGQIGEISEVVSNIAASAGQQSHALREVNDAIKQMDDFTKQNASMVEHSRNASHDLAVDTENLARLSKRFKVVRDDQIDPRKRANASATRPNRAA